MQPIHKPSLTLYVPAPNGGELVALSGMRFDAGEADSDDIIEQHNCRPDFQALI